MDLRRRNKREAARAALELEAAEIIDVRIADGRPPPEVFQAAAARQAAKGQPADAWYRPADAPAPQGPAPTPDKRRLAPAAGSDLVLRMVHMPLPAAPLATATTTRRRGATAPRVVVEASN